MSAVIHSVSTFNNLTHKQLQTEIDLTEKRIRDLTRRVQEVDFVVADRVTVKRRAMATIDNLKITLHDLREQNRLLARQKSRRARHAS